MEHIQGCEFDGLSKRFVYRQKVDFASKLKAIMHKLNIELLEGVISAFTLHGCLENPRWNVFPESFRQSRNAFVTSQSLPGHAYTHGDLSVGGMKNDGEMEIAFLSWRQIV